MVERFKGSGRPREGGFLAVHRQDFNAHTTGGDWRHTADQTDMNPPIAAFNNNFSAPTVQATLENMVNAIGNAPIQLSPLGTGADDWPALVRALITYANKRAIVMGPGTWICKSEGYLPSGTVLIASPGVRVETSMGYSGGAATNSVFDTTRRAEGLLTTLAGDSTPGLNTITTNGVVDIGNIIGIQSQAGAKLRWSYYTVTGVSGVGPYTVTLERPVLNQFSTNDKVYTIGSRPSNIFIFGNGMTITGTGDTALQFWQATNCHVFDVNIDNSTGSFRDCVARFDLGCDNCSFTRVKSYGSGVGMAMSSAEACIFDSCRNAYSIGGGDAFVLSDSVSCEIKSCQGFGSTNGVIVQSASGDGVGCISCKVSGGLFFDNTYGIHVLNGSTNTSLLGIDVKFNTTAGIRATQSGGSTSGIMISGDVRTNAIDYSITNSVPNVQFMVSDAVSGSVMFYWHNYYYNAASGTYYMHAGDTDGYAQPEGGVDWSRFRIPFDVYLEGMYLYNRLENATDSVDYELWTANDTLLLASMNKRNGAYSATAGINAVVAQDDILTMHVIQPTFGSPTVVNGVLVVWGRRVPYGNPLVGGV